MYVKDLARASEALNGLWQLPGTTRYGVALARMPYTFLHSKAEYFRLAEQSERLARSATTDAERRGFQVRADLFRQLGKARLETNDADHHFPPKRTNRFREPLA